MLNVLLPFTAGPALVTPSAPVPGQISRYNASAGALSPQLMPLASLTVGAIFQLEKDELDTTGNLVTISCTPGDQFESGITSKVLAVSSQWIRLVVVSITGTKFWALEAQGIGLTALDVRYNGGSPVNTGMILASTYGAKGDGIADDTAALQRAFNAAGTRIVYIAAGIYLYTALVLPRTIAVLGDVPNSVITDPIGTANGWTTNANQRGTWLRCTATSGSSITVSTTSAMDQPTLNIKNIGFVGPGTGTAIGLSLLNLKSCNLENVWTCNFDTGMKLDGCYDSVFTQLYSIGNNTGIWVSNISNQNTWVNTNLQRNTNFALRISNSVVNAFYGGVTEMNTGTVVSLESAHAARFSDWYFEDTTCTTMASISNLSDSNSFNGCHISSNNAPILINGNHNQVWNCEGATPPITIGASTYNNFLVGLFTGAITNNNEWQNFVWAYNYEFAMASGARVPSGQKIYLETSGTGSYIGRDIANGNTVISSGSNLTLIPASQCFRTGIGTTGNRPPANSAGAGAGAQFYDSSLSKPIWSDGTVWRDAAGTAV